MELKTLIKQRRTELNKTLEDIANEIGVSKATVQRWESGEIKDMRRSKIVDLAKALRVEPAYLMEWETDNFISVTEDVVKIPILGEVAAGYNRCAVEDWENGSIEIPRSYLRGRPEKDYFMLRVHGDSMYPLYIDGDIVLVLKQATLNRSGDIGVLIINDNEATLKKVEYVHGENWMKVLPINPQYPPVMVEGEALEHCRVLGIPRMLIREIKE